MKKLQNVLHRWKKSLIRSSPVGVELAPYQMSYVVGGSPKGTWGAVDSPKGTWSALDSPKGTW